MNNTFYFLRHGKTKVDSGKPISQWVLSDVGEEQALKCAQSGIFDEVDVIMVSGEEKSFQTAKPIADKLKKEIDKVEEINELDRDKGGFLSSEKYEETVRYCLEHPLEIVNNWEMASKALKRFSKKIEEIDKEYENKKILIVGHGYTINMYFAHLLGVIDQVYKRLNTNTFADWGIVKNGKVIKDISR